MPPSVAHRARSLGFIIFVGLLWPTFLRGAKAARRSRPEAESAYALELESALGWLRDHSPSDATVMAPWQSGAAITALARRRVVATSIAPLGEASETASRWRDIARFFFSEDESAAREIARRYQASFVLVERPFPAWLCRAIGKCEYATSDARRLNSLGLTDTLAGRMSRGETLRYYEPVFDSPRFVIYEEGARDARFTEAQRRVALHVARRVVDTTLAGRRSATPVREGLPKHPAVVEVSVWRAGRLRGAAVAEGASVGSALVTAAERAAKDEPVLHLRPEETSDSRIAVAVGRDDYAPASGAALRQAFLDPVRSYRLSAKGRHAYAFRYRLASDGIFQPAQLLRALCARAGLSAGCEQVGAVETFNAEEFMEDGAGGMVELQGPLQRPANPPSETLLRDRARLAADWLLRVQDATGRFPLSLDAISGKPDGELREGRNAAAGQSLVEASAAFGDDRYLRAAERNGEFLERTARESSPNDPLAGQSFGALAFESLEDLALFDATHRPEWLSRGARRCRSLWSRRTSGTLPWNNEEQTTYALLALTRCLEREPGVAPLDQVAADAALLRERFRRRRTVETVPPNIGLRPYLIAVFLALHRLSGDSRDAEFALEVAQWVVEAQAGGAVLPSASYGGPAVPPPSAIGIGVAAEGLLQAHDAARCFGKAAAANRFRAATFESLGGLVQLQLTGPSRELFPQGRSPAARGGVRFDASTPSLWSDAAAHFVIPAARLISHRAFSRCSKTTR